MYSRTDVSPILVPRATENQTTNNDCSVMGVPFVRSSFNVENVQMIRNEATIRMLSSTVLIPVILISFRSII